MRTPDAAMRTSLSHVYYPWQVSWRLQSLEGPLYQGNATQDAQSIKFSKTGRYRVPSTLARRQQFFLAATGTTPERTTDGCCY